MAGVDEDLNQLDKDIRALKIEFDQYFGGGRKRPPSDTQWRIEQTIKRYSERGAQMNFGQRFRFNNLTQTYAKYNEVWRKKLKQKEEGVVQRHYGAAAKAIQAERAMQEREHPAPASPAEAARAGRQAGYAASFSDPERESEKVQDLYKALVDAKQKAGERTDALTLDNFQSFVKQKTEQLRQKGANQVEYAVTLEDGQVKLKARVKS
jgi:hypothetical protein